MEIKRCVRCGGFFQSANDICQNCVPKDNKDLGKLKTYLSGYVYCETTTRREVSYSTGITMKNLNRFLESKEFSDVNIPKSIEDEKNVLKKVAK